MLYPSCNCFVPSKILTDCKQTKQIFQKRTLTQTRVYSLQCHLKYLIFVAGLCQLFLVQVELPQMNLLSVPRVQYVFISQLNDSDWNLIETRGQFVITRVDYFLGSKGLNTKCQTLRWSWSMQSISSNIAFGICKQWFNQIALCIKYSTNTPNSKESDQNTEDSKDPTPAKIPLSH